MNSLTNNRNTLIYAGVGFLLFFFCYRLWNLGITHTDDAIWFLASQQGNWGVISEFAMSQGRIWAYVSGFLIYVTLYFQESIVGQFIRVGSFSVFFILFYYVIAIYFGRRLALMSAVLNLALYAMRWEGSIVNTYPAFAWILSSLFLCAVWMNWSFSKSNRSFFFYASLATFFLSLFLHEGTSVLFSVLYVIAILSNYCLIHGRPSLFGSIFSDGVVRRQLSGAVVIIGLYFVLYLSWRLAFPTNYAGNTLGEMDFGRALTTLLGLTSSGSVLFDLIHPYSVNFADVVGQDGYRITYSVPLYLRAVADSPSAFVAAFVVFSSIFLICSSNGQEKDGINRWRIAVAGAVVGVVIAILPILPVALVGKYQNHYFELGVHSYAYTALSHFGITLGIASVALWAISFASIKTVNRKLISVLVALITTVIAYCGFQMNDAIASDIHAESNRWKAVNLAMGLAEKVSNPINLIYSPRMFSGSWFTVLDAKYWSQYVSLRYNREIILTRDAIPISLTEGNAAYMDFISGRNVSQLIAILAPLGVQGADKTIAVNKILVAIDRPDPSDLEQFVLTFNDQKRGYVQVRFSQMEPLNKEGTFRSISNLSAHPSSINVHRYSSIKGLPVSCDKSIYSGLTIFFGTTSSGDGPSCVASNWLQGGWNNGEQLGAWTKERNAEIVIPTVGLSHGNLILNFTIGTFTGVGFSDISQTVSLRSGQNILSTRTDKRGVGFQSMKIQIPSNQWTVGKDITLSVDVDPIINPSKERISDDKRNLGAYLKSLHVEVIKNGSL